MLFSDMTSITGDWILDIPGTSETGGGFPLASMASSHGQMVRSIKIQRPYLTMHDAVLGLTYFFKDRKYWRFNDYMVITESEVPQDSASIWFGC